MRCHANKCNAIMISHIISDILSDILSFRKKS